MHTAILLLALGMAVAVAAGSVSDHGELLTTRNLAAHRAERAAQTFVQGCASGGCQSGDVSQTTSQNIRLTGCIRQSGDSTALMVEASLAWSPQVFMGLTPAKASTVVDLGGFAASAEAVLPQC
ncbi:MAG: hypothetical protein F4138_04440 [Acidimicrobiia bacterium]|nr:hypothetical protein [Acidimicrobiia bacterium]MYC58468.1 hypothetical protein [Acidimicrobiia bacterium]MYG94226.1 hypothetical protein [Acidimicrobiia bacterium]MYI30426.1 hypothetical protein [Acidimicrobiia bacterium]